MKFNLSELSFFNLYVKDNDWFPLQNHGLIDKEIKLQKEDSDFPNQITTYLNLFKNIDINNLSVLDIGCGWGRGPHTIKKYFKNSDVTGMDINFLFIDFARSNFKNCKYIQDDLFETKINNNSFDFIVSNCSMHFFYDQDVIYKNIKNILKPKGKLLITDIWNSKSFLTFLDKCKQHNFKILSIEDLTNPTIEAIERDIEEVLPKFIDKVSSKSIDAFLEIQKERLTFFRHNINRQYKFIVQIR